MNRIESWVNEQREAKERAEERVKRAREEREEREMRRLAWEGRRRKVTEKEKKPKKMGVYERCRAYFMRLLQPRGSRRVTMVTKDKPAQWQRESTTSDVPVSLPGNIHRASTALWTTYSGKNLPC